MTVSGVPTAKSNSAIPVARYGIGVTVCIEAQAVEIRCLGMQVKISNLMQEKD